MYAMKLLALGAAMALSTFGEADAMKLLGKEGHRHRRHQAPASTIITKSGGETESTKSARSTAGDFATKAKAAAGAIDSRVASYLKTFKNPRVKAIGEKENSSLRKAILVVLVLCLIAVVIIVIAVVATSNTGSAGPKEGTPDDLVKRDFNDGENGTFMTEYVDLDGNRADFEEVNVYVYDSQSAYLNARENHAEVGVNLFVGETADGRIVIDGANSQMRYAGGRFGAEGIDVNYHRPDGTGWDNYATTNLATTYVNAY